MNRKTFHKELIDLNNMVIRMASYVISSFEDTAKLLEEYDEEFAKIIIIGDDRIDKLEEEIENECIKLISTQQPVARDLRQVASILKLVTDLERIGDNCVDIAEYVLKMGKVINIPRLKEMFDLVQEIFKDTVNSYIKLDMEKALYTIKKDDLVDEMFEEITNNFKNNMSSSEVEYLFIIKYLEKIADHCCNICEWIAYRVTGVIDGHLN
ncbi:MAG: phosphate signaling complex protein PhoU [Lachnospirales bacterium]